MLLQSVYLNFQQAVGRTTLTDQEIKDQRQWCVYTSMWMCVCVCVRLCVSVVFDTPEGLSCIYVAFSL